jgi:polynucleotide 5'-kinase involved in rRNA processing
MGCVHKSCGSTDKVWLPFEINNRILGLKPHSYCIHCGIIKSISTDKPKKTAYYINIFTNIDKSILKITKVQTRLIVKELESIEDFEDVYSMTRQAQENIFIKIVQNYCNVSEGYIASILKN